MNGLFHQVFRVLKRYIVKKVKVTGVYDSIICKNEEIWTVQKVTLRFYETVFY
jgi:hypothetical protein